MRCAFRLLGLCQDEVKVAAAFDRRLGLLAKVYAVVEDRACRKILLIGVRRRPRGSSRARGSRRRRGGAPAVRPGRGERGVPGDRRGKCARLRPLLARHEEEERDNREDLPRRVSFDDSAEGERVHRYQAHWSGSLLRDPRGPGEPPGGRDRRRSRAGTLAAFPGPRTPHPRGQGSGASPGRPTPVRGPAEPHDERCDAAKQSQRGRGNLKKIKRLRRKSRRERSLSDGRRRRRHHVPFPQPGSLGRSRYA